jgi:hypothetical protein
MKLRKLLILLPLMASFILLGAGPIPETAPYPCQDTGLTGCLGPFLPTCNGQECIAYECQNATNPVRCCFRVTYRYYLFCESNACLMTVCPGHTVEFSDPPQFYWHYRNDNGYKEFYAVTYGGTCGVGTGATPVPCVDTFPRP